MEKDHFRKLERMYYSAPINAFFKPTLKVEHGKTEISITVHPDFFHAASAVHGSVYFKALDDAAFFAVNSLVEDVFVLTANFNLYFFQPIQKGDLIAYGTVVYESKSSYMAEAVLYDPDGAQIARGSGSFIRSKIPLSEDIGYR